MTVKAPSRISKKSVNAPAQLAFSPPNMHNAFGRRVETKNSLSSANTRRYYYNYNWQIYPPSVWRILSDYDGSNNYKRSYVYGNGIYPPSCWRIDEVLMQFWFYATSQCKYYLHDHLYSPIAVTNYLGQTAERYEYDAYGKCYILEPNFAPDPDQKPDFGNPFLFTGRELDILDNGSLRIMNYRHRYYDTYTGRFTTHDPLAIVPDSQAMNYFKPDDQYLQGLSLYEYTSSNPLTAVDPWGLVPNYVVDGSIPAWPEFVHGDWDIGGVPSYFMFKQLCSIVARAYGDVAAGYVSISMRDAARHLKHYLGNSGIALLIDYQRMLKDSKDARNHFIYEFKIAMQAAENFADPDDYTKIVDTAPDVSGSYDAVVDDDVNWQWAIQHYWTWGHGWIRKDKGRKRCCYYMNWTHHLRDLYEFENSHQLWGGLVWDDEMWLLNHYGVAQHFKIGGQKSIRFVWIKGYDLKYENEMDLISGKQKPVPQCQ